MARISITDAEKKKAREIIDWLKSQGMTLYAMKTYGKFEKSVARQWWRGISYPTIENLVKLEDFAISIGYKPKRKRKPKT